eukprot:366043-Chlamydomonas_euryale.AAC.1
MHALDVATRHALSNAMRSIRAGGGGGKGSVGGRVSGGTSSGAAAAALNCERRAFMARAREALGSSSAGGAAGAGGCHDEGADSANSGDSGESGSGEGSTSGAQLDIWVAELSCLFEAMLRARLLPAEQ